MVGWYILLAGAGVLFLAIQFAVLPKIFSTYRYGWAEPCDRGRKIIKEVNGESILYDTEPDTADVIPQYLLSVRGGEKRLVCRLNECVRTVDYDVALFNKNGEVFRVLNVREEVERPGHAREIALPKETEYVSLYLNAADGVRRKGGAPSGRISRVRFVICFFACIIAEVLLFWPIRLCIARVFGGLYDESYLTESSITAAIFWVFMIATVLNLLFAGIVLLIGNRKKKRRARRAEF